MALPTAPLGSLPTMNMPYEIPHYNKGPNIWEQALAQFLVSAAGQAASKGTDNVLEKEHASEFGQKSAGFMSKLTGGATVNDAEAKQLRQNTFQAGQANKDRAFQADELDQRLQAQQGMSEADAANARIRAQMGIDADTTRQDQADSARLNLAVGDRTAATDLVNLKDRLERSNPENQARTGLYGAQASEHQANADFYRRILNPNGGQVTSTLQGQQSKVDPSIAAFAQGKGRPAPTVAGPAQPSMEDMVRQALASGQSPDAILAGAQTGNARQAATDTRAAGLQTRDVARSAQQEALVQRILQQMGINNLPSTDPTFTGY